MTPQRAREAIPAFFFMQYGKGGKVKYSYDEFDRVIGVKYDAETVDRYTYEYGANGQVAEVTDNNLNRTVRTEYDLADRPMQSELRDGSGKVLYRTGLKYDKLNNPNNYPSVSTVKRICLSIPAMH